MPGTSGISIDTDSILSDTMRNIPVGSIGILQNSMFRTDRVAGMAEIFGFGGNAALFARNEQWQKEYEEAFGVMRNLQVLDVLNGIIDNFNSQLSEANRNVYDGVKWNLRYADPFYEADFKRHEKENLWSIRVCVESNLTGDKFKTREFRDYTGMKNETVILSPIKGLKGGEIDFTDADTYVNLDADELDVYVGLESSKLNDEIENVFAEEGTFKTHVDEEYKRLGDAFGKFYGQWAAGEAMQNAGFYAKPIFPNGPNIMTTAAIAASFTGSPWAMIAVSALSTGINIADGTVSWQQAGVQMGVGFAKSATGMLSPLVDMAASGITYDADGGVGWDKKQFKKGIKTSAIRAGIQFATGSSVATDVLMSGVEVGGSWTDIGFDNSHWGEHIMTGVASGISQGVGAATGNAVLGSMVQQGLLTAAYNMSGGHGFKTDYSGYNWNAMAPSAETFGSQLGNMFSSYMKERYARTENGKSVPYDSGRSDPLGLVDDMLGAAYYGMQKVNEYANDISAGIRGFTGLDHVQGLGLDLDQGFSNVGQSAAYRVMGAGSAVWGGVKDFGEHTSNLFTDGHFASDEEVSRIKEAENWAAAERTYLYAQDQIASGNVYADTKAMEEYGGYLPIWGSNNDYANKTDSLSLLQKLNLAEEKTVNYEDDPQAGTPVNSDKVLEMLINGDLDQFNGGLSKQLKQMITANKSDLIKLFGKEIDFSRKNETIKITMLNADVTKDGETIKSADTIKDYAKNLSHFMCVYLTMYTQVVKADSSRRDYTMGQFYVDLFKSGVIDPSLPARQKYGTQEILDKVYGDGTYLVYGAGKDTGNEEQLRDLEGNTSANKNEKFKKLREYGNQFNDEIFTVRFLVRKDVLHNMDVYSDKGVLYSYDTAGYGTKALMYDPEAGVGYVNERTIQSWYFVQKASAQEKMQYRQRKLQQKIEEVDVKPKNKKRK